jgi:hypothetical protein
MDIELPSPPAVSALRESFGDRKPPDITRKITACVACRKQKVILIFKSTDTVTDGLTR